MTIASVEKKSNFVGMFMRKDNTCLTVDVEELTFPVIVPRIVWICMNFEFIYVFCQRTVIKKSVGGNSK